MPEETAFSVLVKIMYNYGHRNLFKANFRDLHLMFYQLDRLLEVHMFVCMFLCMYICMYIMYAVFEIAIIHFVKFLVPIHH